MTLLGVSQARLMPSWDLPGDLHCLGCENVQWFLKVVDVLCIQQARARAGSVEKLRVIRISSGIHAGRHF